MFKKSIIFFINILFLLTIFSGCATSSKENEGSDISSDTNFDISFDSTTLDGETINSSSFKDYKITMINIWATWCPPCIAEIPDLAKLYDELPEGSNLIAFTTDAGDSEKAKNSAKDILSKSNAKYKNVVPDETIMKFLSKSVQYLPTTIFVDNKGNLIGEPLIGAPNGDVVGGYKKAIEERISMVK